MRRYIYRSLARFLWTLTTTCADHLAAHIEQKLRVFSVMFCM
jgi:hypothetical protein